jgi:cytochrome c
MPGTLGACLHADFICLPAVNLDCLPAVAKTPCSPRASSLLHGHRYHPINFPGFCALLYLFVAKDPDEFRAEPNPRRFVLRSINPGASPRSHELRLASSMRRIAATFFSLSVLFSTTILSAAEKNPMGGRGGSDWEQVEYGSDRSIKDLRTAYASKAFAWLSGSPADNEKLSIGKNAQLFGFVALRYQSGRAANRGAIGRAFFAISDESQRAILEAAVNEEVPLLVQWWSARNDMLRLLETHLYTGEKIDEKKLQMLGEIYGDLGGKIALIEAKAYAALEDELSDEQRTLLTAWREDPEKVTTLASENRVRSTTVNQADLKQLEDLFAKCFAWLTGTPADTQVFPLGQPAQFFGFVSIRHKSGHAANRGQISRSFLEILSRSQERQLDTAVREAQPVTNAFITTRNHLLAQMQLLRHNPEKFDAEVYADLSRKLGVLEAKVAAIEAQAYRAVRATMTDEQTAQMMKLRGEYIIDSTQIESLSLLERGATLFMLCAGCHGLPGQPVAQNMGPTLDGILGRKIATAKNYDYSQALHTLADQESTWTPALLDEYLQGPRRLAPGTKMEFQGLLLEADRTALIDYLQSLKR